MSSSLETVPSEAQPSAEAEFIEEALQFLLEIGADTSAVQPDTHLFDAEVLDSLGTLAFLDFLEQRIGEEIEVERLDLDSIATLRHAYRFVLDQRNGQ